MSKRKVCEIEAQIKINWKDYTLAKKWEMPKISEDEHLGSLKSIFHIADYASDYAIETYDFWDIAYAKEMSKILGIRKDKTEMKVTGTYINNKIVLDHPVEYVGVFTPSKNLTSLRNGNRYEFEVKTMGSTKPEIIGANKIENKRDTNWQIVLGGGAIENYPNKSIAERVAVKMISQNILDAGDFKSGHEKVLEATKNGQVILYSGNDVFEKLLTINSEDVALFHVVSSDNITKLNTPNKQSVEGIFVDNFYLQDDLVPMLPVFKNAMSTGERFSLLLTGEAGYGKTSAFKAIAQQLDVPYLYVDCSVMLNTTDWFGIMQAKDGSTFFEETEFTRFLKNGNCVIILDEFNRLSIEVANSLLPILDDRCEIRVKNQQITVGDSILFGITLNEGIEYTGIGGMLDKAIKSRIFGKVQVKPLPFSIEIEVVTRNYNLPPEMAEKIVSVMNNLREVCQRERDNHNFITADVSTRTTKMVAWWVEKGLDIEQALGYALYNFVGKDELTLFTDKLKISGVL